MGLSSLYHLFLVAVVSMTVRKSVLTLKNYFTYKTTLASVYVKVDRLLAAHRIVYTLR